MMKPSVRLLLMLSILSASSLIAPAFADEQPEPNLSADAALSGNRPPTVIPHQIGDDVDGTACNQCHVGSARKAPHPDRLNCTQCHLPGDVKKSGKSGKKGARK